MYSSCIFVFNLYAVYQNFKNIFIFTEKYLEQPFKFA